MAGFSVPIATVSALGIISVGAGLAVTTAGVLSATGAPAPATTVALGSVIVPVAGRLAVDGSGNISVPLGSAATFGVVKVDGVTITAAAGVITATAGSPPLATTTTAGTVIVPVAGNLAVDGSGNISVPRATGAVFGVVKITAGNGLALAAGVVSVSLATNAAAGTVIVPVAGNLAVDGSGNISVPLATGAVFGVVKITAANGLALAAGVVSVSLATNVASGTVIVPTANGLSVTAGSIAMGLASAAAFGAVKVDGTTITAAAGVISAVAPAAGSLVLISTKTANNSSPNLEWTGLGSTYTNYLLIISNLLSSTSGDSALLQYGEGGGPTYVTSGYSYGGNRTDGGGTNTGFGSTSAAGISLNFGSGIQNNAGIGFSGDYTIKNIPCVDTSETMVSGTGNGSLSASSGGDVWGRLASDTTAKTAIRITNNNGNNWTTGRASLYGITP